MEAAAAHPGNFPGAPVPTKKNGGRPGVSPSSRPSTCSKCSSALAGAPRHSDHAEGVGGAGHGTGVADGGGQHAGPPGRGQPRAANRHRTPTPGNRSGAGYYADAVVTDSTHDRHGLDAEVDLTGGGVTAAAPRWRRRPAARGLAPPCVRAPQLKSRPATGWLRRSPRGPARNAHRLTASRNAAAGSSARPLDRAARRLSCSGSSA